VSALKLPYNLGFHEALDGQEQDFNFMFSLLTSAF
jgi:hypothetical protein